MYIVANKVKIRGNHWKKTRAEKTFDLENNIGSGCGWCMPLFEKEVPGKEQLKHKIWIKVESAVSFRRDLMLEAIKEI